MRVHVEMSDLDILRFAKSRAKETWTYIVTGRTGPTGKTYLCDLLKRQGYHAIEISEDIFTLVEYKDGKNHFLINDAEKYAIIIKNRILPKYADKWVKKVDFNLGGPDAFLPDGTPLYFKTCSKPTYGSLQMELYDLLMRGEEK